MRSAEPGMHSPQSACAASPATPTWNRSRFKRIGITHHMPSLWPDPDRFDPDRFGEAARAGRRRGAYVPFGGGAHMCLGLNFAVMQAKCFARHLLQSLSVGMAPDYVAAW